MHRKQTLKKVVMVGPNPSVLSGNDDRSYKMTKRGYDVVALECMIGLIVVGSPPSKIG